MREKLIGLYEEFVAYTNDPVAASVLVLAHVTSCRGEQANAAAQDSLLDLRQAATILGYAPAGLRKLVAQRRIQFVQNGRGPIKFRREWLDAFIASNENGPLRIVGTPTQPRASRKGTAEPSRFGLDPGLLRKEAA